MSILNPYKKYCKIKIYLGMIFGSFSQLFHSNTIPSRDFDCILIGWKRLSRVPFSSFQSPNIRYSVSPKIWIFFSKFSQMSPSRNNRPKQEETKQQFQIATPIEINIKIFDPLISQQNAILIFPKKCCCYVIYIT